MDLEAEPAARRRRGSELEDALLQAAWDELFASGYAGLTIDAVAQRAGTSRPVIYRRWSSKAELVLAAVRHGLRRDPATVPDTGSLRDDMAGLLRLGNRRRVAFTALLTFHLGAYFQETGTSPDDLRRGLFGEQPSPVDVVIDRAVERGEIDGERLTPRLRTLAFDLYRHEALMTLEPVPDDVIDFILDDVFMPLVKPG